MILRGLLLVAALSPGCSGDSPSSPEPASLDQAFDLKAGAAAVVTPDGLRITFEKVAGDSRCAVDVVCVWEGDAEIVLKAETTPENRETLSLHTSGRFQVTAEVHGHVIELRGLRPGNKAGVPIDPKAYVATLRVSRLQR